MELGWSENIRWILFLILPLVSFLYASVGHGGASSYIVILTLLQFSPAEIRPQALILNSVVSLIAFLAYRQTVEFPYKLFLLLSTFSVPAAFIGSFVSLDPGIYRKILGVLLLFPVLRFMGFFPSTSYSTAKPSLALIAIIGLSIGAVSGLIGIGGGIILSPLLLILGWTDLKQTAALSALFIFVNSLTGLAGAGIAGNMPESPLLQILPLALVGGMAGAYFGAKKFRAATLRYLLTTVLLIASVKLIGG